jgi:predicted glycosyltransferase
VVDFRVWIDVLTSKQATLFSLLSRELLGRGYEVLVTCRDYEYTVGALRRFGVEPVVIGRYVIGSPYDKVLGDADRMFGLAVHVERFKPDVLVAYPNPPAARLAFGVGIKYVAITDSPHAQVPSRLSLPLADVVIVSDCIPEEDVRKYMFGGSRLVRYGGVDEVSWLLRSMPDLSYVEGLGLEPYKYVVIRPHEHHATYYKGVKLSFDLMKLMYHVLSNDLKIVFLPRYPEHKELINELPQTLKSEVIVVEGSYDGVSLAFYARAVVSGGSTLAREAALLNTVGITYYPGLIHVNECVRARGYPLFKVSTTEEALALISEAGSKGKDVGGVLGRIKRDFEDLIGVVVKVLEGGV